MIFLTQMEKLTVCKEGIIKFKTVNSSDTVVGFFPQIMNDRINIFFYLLNTPSYTPEFHLEFHISGSKIYPMQRLSSKSEH